MKFFEQQALARRNTTLLIVLFIVVANFLAALNAVLIGQVILKSFSVAQAVYVVSLAAFLLIYWRYRTRWSQGDSVALSLGGSALQEARDAGEARLRNVVEEMSIASGVPVPKIFILGDDSSINAFAAGVDHRFAAIGVTRGAVDRLSRDELQAVVAHEFSHILNEDMVLNMRLAAVVGVFTVYSTMGRLLLEGVAKGSSSSKDSGTAVLAALGFLLWVLGFLGTIIGRLIQAVVSRHREFLADASSAQFTRAPRGLAMALAKIAYGPGSRVFSVNVDRFGHFFFAEGTGIERFFASHPPLGERIRRLVPGVALEDLAAQAKADLKGTQASEGKPMAMADALTKGRLRITQEEAVAALAAEAISKAPLGESEFEHRIGSVTDGDLLTARSKISRVGHMLGRPLKTADDAVNVLRGLVVMNQAATSHEQILEQYEKREHGLGREIIAHARALPDSPVDRLTILRLVLGLIQTKPLAQKQALIHEIRALTAADHRTTWFEQLLIVTAMRQLVGQMDGQRLIRGGILSMPDRVFRLLFWAASDGRGSEKLSPEERKKIFARVRQAFPGQLPERLDGIRIPPVEDALALDDFDHLDRLPRQEKARLLRAFSAIHVVDQKPEDIDVESLRLAAWMFGVPMPPLTI